MRYKVRATFRGKRIITTKYWFKKRLAQDFADNSNFYYPKANARVVKFPKGRK